MALSDTRRGEPVGHLVGLDAACSGIQIMSTLTGCHAGARASGLVDPEHRADAYTLCTALMREWVPELPENDRKRVKSAVMPYFYGSTREPKNVFGEDTPELEAFHKAMFKMAPGACELLEDLLKSWRPYALCHSWVLPDNHHVHVQVMKRIEDKRIEVDELDHHRFKFVYYVNQGLPYGKKNAANVIHSIDAYVLRSVFRRCNYDEALVALVMSDIQIELMERAFEERSEFSGACPSTDLAPSGSDTTPLAVCLERFAATRMIDPTVFEHLTVANIRGLESDYLRRLEMLAYQMLSERPFPVIAIHDEFKCHPNHMNQLRFHYREIIAELAESTVLDDIFSALLGRAVHYPKRSTDLGDTIRQSNYALC